jgi:hypothetical protein
MSERSSDDDLIREEEAAARRDAGHIGGVAGDEDDDPAYRAVNESGGGEAEGFELAEEDLIRNASHDDGKGDPLADAFTGEVESDRSGAEYGEADSEDPEDLGRD